MNTDSILVAAFEGAARKRGRCQMRSTLSHTLQRGYSADSSIFIVGASLDDARERLSGAVKQRPYTGALHP